MCGRPNSVTIIDSSMHMAADVEFGNFLTMMYFEKISSTIRKFILFQYKYVANVCHGNGAVPGLCLLVAETFHTPGRSYTFP